LGLDRKLSSYIGPVRDHLAWAGYKVEIVAVQYEFQRAEDHAGNRMMRVSRSTLPASLTKT
jgi:hypothetical protein